MIEYTFTIEGNHTGNRGNPIGYTRVLSNGWRADATRYMNWCKYVRTAFYLAKDPKYGLMKWSELGKMPKPLTTTKDHPARMDIEIEYANNQRPDGDNVFKGIADALFDDDKYLMAGSYVGSMSAEKKGRVLVKIKIQE